MAVWVFNNSSHRFSSLPPQYLISSPLEMRYVRRRDYMKKVGNYKDMSPYYNIELVDNVGPRPFGFPTERYYVEIDKENPKQRYKYRRFEKGADRHFFNTIPRQIKYVIGNKFILEGDEVNPNNEPDEKGDETRE